MFRKMSTVITGSAAGICDSVWTYRELLDYRVCKTFIEKKSISRVGLEYAVMLKGACKAGASPGQIAAISIIHPLVSLSYVIPLILLDHFIVNCVFKCAGIFWKTLGKCEKEMPVIME